MLSKIVFTSLLSVLLLQNDLHASDTLLVQAKDINTKVLIPGTHRWLVYFKMGKDSSRSRFFIWSRSIEKLRYKDRDAISVRQEWENNDKSCTRCILSVMQRILRRCISDPGRRHRTNQYPILIGNLITWTDP